MMQMMAEKINQVEKCEKRTSLQFSYYLYDFTYPMKKKTKFPVCKQEFVNRPTTKNEFFVIVRPEMLEILINFVTPLIWNKESDYFM